VLPFHWPNAFKWAAGNISGRSSNSEGIPDLKLFAFSPMPFGKLGMHCPTFYLNFVAFLKLIEPMPNKKCCFSTYIQ
jgi:hypothetical protein